MDQSGSDNIGIPTPRPPIEHNSNTMDSSVNMTAQHKKGVPFVAKMAKSGPSLKNYKVSTRLPLTTDHELRVSNPGEAESKKTFKK